MTAGADWEERAARNNAVWCDSVCRSHGAPGEFNADVWMNRRETPPFYGNLITLTRDGADAQLRSVGELLESDLSGDWGVKDAFYTLDLAPLGFELLFEARWIVGEGGIANRATMPDVRWTTAGSPADLAAWEHAWRRAPGNTLPDATPPIFPAGLAEDPDIAFLAAHRDGECVAGCIANRAVGTVGLSNLFSAGSSLADVVASCAAAAAAAFPGLPLVGYEQGDTLDAFGTQGFEVRGPLRVWIRELVG